MYNGTAAWYWLRSPNIASTSTSPHLRVATYILQGRCGSDPCTRGDGGVRPALPKAVKAWCSPSRKAKAASHSIAAWYWLRSVRMDIEKVAYVTSQRGLGGARYSATNGGVRPALPEVVKESCSPSWKARRCLPAPPRGIGSARHITVRVMWRVSASVAFAGESVITLLTAVCARPYPELRRYGVARVGRFDFISRHRRVLLAPLAIRFISRNVRSRRNLGLYKLLCYTRRRCAPGFTNSHVIVLTSL